MKSSFNSQPYRPRQAAVPASALAPNTEAPAPRARQTRMKKRPDPDTFTPVAEQKAAVRGRWHILTSLFAHAPEHV